ncbi:hypothetical protein PO909_028499 [Leuciscus waleckii]
MLLFVILLTLTLQPALSKKGQTALSKSGLSQPQPKPQRCVNAVDPEKHYTFLKHHLNNNVPKSDDIKEWHKFITKIKTWHRPVQSFFLYSESEYDKVLAVCSTEGKIFPSKNLCISKKTFNFYNVTVNSKMRVKKVKFITNRHVILGCEKTLNKCLPIHFEANEYAIPDDNQPDCSG